MNTSVGWRKFDYYQWLLEQIHGHVEPYYDYSLLLSELHYIPFTWQMERDKNRASDGERLRWIYMDENNIPDIFYDLGIQVSVLEVLVGLAIRMDIDIAGNGDIAKWFWVMIDNLGLSPCKDECFSAPYVRQQIDIWLSRGFKWDGKGSPFPLRKCSKDQRKVELWLQMCGWLNENL